jgi:hypothetical protein
MRSYGRILLLEIAVLKENTDSMAMKSQNHDVVYQKC